MNGGNATPARPPIQADWTRSQKRILDVMAKHDGPVRGIDIAQETGIPVDTVYSCLKRFAALGVARKVYRGEYELAPVASK